MNQPSLLILPKNNAHMSMNFGTMILMINGHYVKQHQINTNKQKLISQSYTDWVKLQNIFNIVMV